MRGSSLEYKAPKETDGGFGNITPSMTTQKDSKQLGKEIDEVRKLVRSMQLTILPLNADLMAAGEHWQKDRASQFWRRTVIRCLLALLEAALWNMKNTAPKIAVISEVMLSPKELEFAEDKIRPFPKFRKNLGETFELFAKVHKVPFSVTPDKDFEALCATYELRNRLMHPKKPFDLDVSDKNIDEAMQGAMWFRKSFDKLMQLRDAETDKFIEDAIKRTR
jgi:hypothetical protein